MSIDAAIAIAWDVFKSVVAPIKRQFGYVTSSNSYAQDLQKEVGELAYKAEMVQNEVEAARNNGRNIYSYVTQWQANAEKALNEARGLLDDFKKANKTCCYGSLPEPSCRYQFSRLARDKIEGIQRLAQRHSQIKDISLIDLAPGNVPTSTPARREDQDVAQSTIVTTSASFASTSIKLEDDDKFKSRELIMQEIMASLADNSNSVVGMYGMGGVGKSTLLADAERRIREEKSFDWVTKADVSENQDIKRIQIEIALGLGLTDIKNEEYASGRAKLLGTRLENLAREKKKVLIILDNLWEELDLKAVGIPCRHDNKAIKCKLLLTSRSRDILRRKMICDRDFHLEELKEEEAKSLFERMVGDKVHVDPFKSLMDEALRKCAGLPFLIIAMAKIFKDANDRQWKDALKQIEMSTNRGLSEMINKTLQLSYDSLEGKEGKQVKSLLRLCVVYGVSKPSLENLVRYGMGLRLFEEIDKIEDARDRLSSLIHTLQASSLLLDNEDDDGFKIHDLVRGFVASIASREEPLLVWKDNDESVTELPKDKLKSCTALCFPYIEIKQLPEELDCPETQIFLLFTNDDSLKIPDSYFNSMRKLMVLHLSQVCLTPSPSPFKLLEDLHTLCLDGCSLEDVAMIGELKGLHILSFVNSNIHRLPKEIGQLVELRLLDLSKCSQLEIIEPGVLGSLMKLEELYMWNSFDKWNAMEQTPPTNAELIELGNRKNLHTLHVSIPDLRMLPEDLNVKKLTKYNIRIGGARCYQRYKGSSVLELKLHSISDSLKKGCIQTLLGKTDYLLLDGSNGIESICSLSHEGFQKLKHLYVKYSPSKSNNQVGSQVAFFDGQEVAFPNLETLKIRDMDNIEIIWDNQATADSFHKLKSLEAWSCSKLLNIVPSCILGRLKSLESLEVRSCDLLEVVFKLQPLNPLDGHPVVDLPLRRLHLHGLPKLRCVWDKELHNQVKFQCLRFVTVFGCKSLTSLFPASVVHPTQLEELEVRYCDLLEVVFKLQPLNPLDGHLVADLPLKRLMLDGLPKLKCVWDKELHSQIKFQRLRFVTVSRCKSLTSLFPASVVVHLTQLEELKINKCGIVELIEKEDGGVPRFAFPKLTSLELQDLTELRCIYIGKHVSHWPALKTLTICGCHKVEILASHPENDMPFDKESLFLVEKVAFPNLETLKIKDMDNIEIIWDNQAAADSFHKLKSLKVWSCNKLLNIVPSCILGQLKSLESLEVQSCDLLEVVFKLQPLNPLDGHPVVDLPLKRLELDGLPELKCVWDKELHSQVKFRCLRFVIVSRCKSLTSLFLAAIAVHLTPLEELEVRSCDSLEDLFKLQPLNPLDGHPVADLLLKRLNLDGLPKLKCVWDKELHSQVKFQCLRFVTVSGCKSLTYLFPASVVIHLTQLEELEISKCGIVELIEKEGPVLKVVFPRLTSLKLEHLIELKCIYTRIHALCWPALKNLEVQGCNKVEILASQPENEMPLRKQPLFLIEKGTFPNLQELKLDLSGGMEIWHEYFHDGEFFSKLTVLELHHFSKEFAISTRCFVQSLVNLEKLVCKSYQEELSINIEAIAGPSHELEVILPFSFQHLKTLEMSNCNGLSPYIILPFSGFFQHLKTLDMSFCDGLSNIFTLTIARNLVKLTKLRIINCKMLTEVICDEEGEDGLVVAFNELTYIELVGLTRLRCFSSIKYTLMFPLLEDVIVSGCPCIKFFSRGPIEAPKLETVQVSTRRRKTWFWKENLNITIQNMFEEMEMVSELKFIQLSEFPKLIGKWHGKLNPIEPSWQLKSLMVDKCPSFINAIPSKLMLLLVNMRRLKICDCESLEEIFDLEGLVGLGNTWMVPYSMTLDLVNLPKLRQLWNKDLQGSLPYNFLYYITLYNCNNLRHAFNPSMAQCLANLSQVEIKECDWMEGVIEEEEGQRSMLEKITFPSLKRMKLECLPNLTSFLSGKNQILECPKLIKLTIAHCPKMSSLTKQSLLEIDHHSPSLFTPQVQFPWLESMVLSHMDNLRKVWTDNPQHTLTFEHLQKVKIENCKSLENLFPHWVATSLTQLKELQVESCEFEEIVKSGDDTSHSTTAQLLFPQLTSLVFHDVSQLKSFCPNLLTLNWSFLTELRVTHCDKLNMSFVASMNKWAQRDDQHDLSDHEANFSIERGIPTLERLLLVDKDIQSIHDGKFSDDFFGKPITLTLACFHDENVVFPPIFLLQRFQNLQSLEIFCSSFEDIFPDEGLVDEGKHTVLENLEELKLRQLPNLKHVWREGCLVEKILQSIVKFEVCDCPSLTTLFPAMTLFQNMTKLVVKNSSGLMHLVTISAITNLMHLTNMTIIGCEKMKEVVADDGNGEGKVISLGKLGRLTLRNLPSLECFSSTTSCIFKFPSMRSIEVEECPKMKIFCKSTISTPTLYRVTLFRYKWKGDWEGDLNTTIQKLTT